MQLPIKMLTEKQRIRQQQINTNRRQAALRERSKRNDPQAHAKKNKETCKKYRDTKKQNL